MNKTALLLAILIAGGFFLWAQPDKTLSFRREFRKWAHVKSVLVGPQSAAFATEGGIHHIYANDKALEGYDTGKFPDGSVIVYDLLETREVAGNHRRVNPPGGRQGETAPALYLTGGWEFMSFPGGNQTDGKLTAERQATCAGWHANRKDHDFVSANFASETNRR